MEEGITVAEALALEENGEYLGVSLQQLMECAGKSVADVVSTRNPPGARCLIMAGTGRNGGDGMVAARHLASRGFNVELILVGVEEKIIDSNTKRNWEALKCMTESIRLKIIRDSSLLEDIQADIIVDALLGIGVKHRLQPPISNAVEKINDAKALKIAVDVPTGIDASTGEVLGRAVKADMTVTFSKIKRGLVKASEYAGEIIVANIGIPPEAEVYAGPGDVNLTRRSRPPSSHKGDFGRVLVIGGSETFVGAPALAGLAALEAGVDLVYVAAPKQTALAISQYSPNLITVKLSSERLVKADVAQIENYVKRVDVVVMGMGLGLHRETAEAVGAILLEIERQKRALVLDADGLKIYSEIKHAALAPLILTPHRGEFEILTGKTLPTDWKETVDAVKETAKNLNAIVLLKAPIDVISDGGRVKLNRTGNPGMTVGGTGDVLSGLVGGLLALGASPFDASVAGAFVNGLAGDMVYAKKGCHIVPTDLLNHIAAILEHPAIRPSNP